MADGWAPYRLFAQANHQTCLAHLLRRCREMLETAQGGAVRFPRRVQEILRAALTVRDRREAGTISLRGVQIAKGHLAAQMDRLLAGPFTHAANQRLAKHLRRNQNDLFSSWSVKTSKRPTGRPSTPSGRRSSTASRAQETAPPRFPGPSHLDEPPENLSATRDQLHICLQNPPPLPSHAFIRRPAQTSLGR